MRLRLAVAACALPVLGLAGSARAADHPLSWPSCCSSAPYADVVADPGDTATFTTDAGVTFADHPLVWDYADYATNQSGTAQQLTFPTAGTYPFHCAFHSFMHGRIKVGNDLHPTAALSVSSAAPTTADPVTLTYTGTADPDGSIATYEWDFDGDGNADQVTTVDHVTHTYPSAGTFQATVRVRDNGHELSDPAPAKTVAVTASPGDAASTGTTGGSTGNADPGGGGSQDGSVAPGTGPPATAADTTAPAVVRPRVSGGRLRFVLSEDAALRATLRRGGRRVRQLGAALKAGAVAYRLPRGLKPGRYAIRFTLTDAAGNRSRTYSASFRVT